MILIIADTGQLGNKLLLLSNSLSTAIKNNDRLITYSFNEYEKYFNIYNSNKIIKSRTKLLNNKIIKKIMIKILNILYEKSIRHLPLNIKLIKKDTDIKQYDKKNKYIIIDWTYRDIENLLLFKSEINKIISIESEYKKNIDTEIEECKKNYDILIGVHIRRGDYKEWMDGKYYFSFEQYNKVLNEINNLYIDKEVLFILVSNEQISKKFFKGINIKINEGRFIEDLYLLSKCDFIVGPLSTFNRWSSFMGNTPLLTIEDINSKITRNDFKIYPY